MSQYLSHKGSSPKIYLYAISSFCHNLQEFLAVELRRGKVRFSWNNGGGMASIEHDEEIKSEIDVISETESWYRVIAERSV